MIGLIFVFSLLVYTCVSALSTPAIGVIGFYGFVMLDPQWNWRWSLPADFQYQKYIFGATFLGVVVSGFPHPTFATSTKAAVVCLLAFSALVFLSAQQSVSPESSSFFWSVYWKHILTVLIGLVALKNPRLIRALLITVVLAQGYNAFQISLGYFQTGFSRYAYLPWGTNGADNNGYSIITMPMLGIALGLGFCEKRLPLRTLFLGIAVLQIHQVMLLQSRGAMLASILMVSIVVWYAPRTRQNVVTILTGLVMVTLLAGPSVVNEFKSSFESEDKRDSSADSRFYLWQAGWRITMNYPVMGVGPNAARVLVPKPQYYEGGLATGNKALHNLFFDVSTGTGVPGFILYFSVYGIAIYTSYKKYQKGANVEYDPIRLSILAGLTGYLSGSMFSSGLLFEAPYVLIVAALAANNTELPENQPPPIELDSQDKSEFENDD